MCELQDKNLVEAIRNHSLEKDILGVCIGMQLMMRTGDEGGLIDGIGLIDEHVKKLSKSLGRLPHIGWNEISKEKTLINKRCKQSIERLLRPQLSL